MKLKQCRCGSSDITRESAYPRLKCSKKNLFWVGCNHCGFSSKTASNIADARENWNKAIDYMKELGACRI